METSPDNSEAVSQWETNDTFQLHYTLDHRYTKMLQMEADERSRGSDEKGNEKKMKAEGVLLQGSAKPESLRMAWQWTASAKAMAVHVSARGTVDIMAWQSECQGKEQVGQGRDSASLLS